MADTSTIVAALSEAALRFVERLRQGVEWAFADRSTTKAPVQPSEPRRLSLADQWNYLSNIVTTAATRAEEAACCHASATQQLDLAQYALTSLVDELAAVMDMGGRVRRRATVHVLGVSHTPALMPMGGAIAA